ncbi:MAG: LysR family transcriptional regulator [Lachnospiraceae bacterium]|nr:LysR family transcriptional regulator [Lachnospiraceae bacterium]
MTSRQLQLFLTIADQGSFSKAEKTEFISKQALLRQVNQLEDEVGEKLFLRTPYGISLTEAGQLFYDGAKEILDLEDEVLSRCRKSASTREELRVSYVEHQVLLNDVTEAFMQKYPDIRIRRVVHPNHSGEYRVEHGIADVGETFYTKYTASSPYAYTRLADMPYLAAMSHSHTLARKTQVTLDELADYPVIIYAPMVDAGYQQELRKMFASKGRAVRDDTEKGRIVREDAGKGRTVREDASKGRTLRDDAGKTEMGAGAAPYASGTPFLDIRCDVDAQVQAAFFCAETDAVLLTANFFVRTIPELQAIPLAEDWRQEYGIIYQANPSRTVRKYIDLAAAQYASYRR